MAVIGTIRDKFGYLLIGFVGVALVLFIGEGLLSSGFSMFGNSTTVAQVKGTDVSIQEFEQRVDAAANQYKARSGQSTLDQATMDNVREQTWSQMVSEMVFGDEYEKLGITVSSEELFDMVQGANIDPQIIQAFSDPKTGQFDRGRVISFLKNLDNVDENTRAQWYSFEKSLKVARVAAKYNALLAKSLYATKAEAKEVTERKSKIFNFDYVLYPFSAINDKDVKVEEDDIEKYYNEHKALYRQDANSRVVEYVALPIAASTEDITAIKADMDKLAAEFAATTDDSSFLANNSEIKNNEGYYKKGVLPPSIDTLVFGQSKGYISGILEEGNTMRMVKVLDVKTAPDSSKVRHILVAVNEQNTEEKARKTLDSVQTLIKGGAKFEDLAKQISIEPAAKTSGGDLGWFTEGMMVKPFSDAAFAAKKGDMKIVKTQFGLHLLEVTDQTAPVKKVKIGALQKRVEPSAKTTQAIYAQANSLSQAVNNEGFDAAINAKKMIKRAIDLRESDRAFANLENSRPIVSWAFRGKEGEVSKVFETTEAYVIARVQQVREKGILPLKQVRELVTVEATKAKKAQMMANKMKSSTSLEAVSQAIKSAVITNMETSPYSSSIAGTGREAKVAGYLSAMKPGQTSKPIEGVAGVYMVRLMKSTDAFRVDDNMIKGERSALDAGLQQRASYDLFNQVKEESDVKDLRFKFY